MLGVIHQLVGREINLDKKVTVAKIAKVREKVSDGDVEYSNVEDAMEDIPEDTDEAEENLIFPTEDDDDDGDGGDEE